VTAREAAAGSTDERPSTGSRLLSRRDVAFLLYEWLDVGRLADRSQYRGHSRETFDDVLALYEAIAADHFAGHNRKGDAFEPSVHGGRVRLIPEVAGALAAYTSAGLLACQVGGPPRPRELPYVIAQAGFAWVQAANIASAAYLLLTAANANLILAHGSPAQVERYVPALESGRWFGTMCLSEPHAGSSLGDLTTRAEPQVDGTYRVFGDKCWISAGDHELTDNIVHLVLARVPGAAPGVKGLSLFIVPKVVVGLDGQLHGPNDVTLVGLIHKMGYRGATNTLLNFGGGRVEPGGKPGAVGELVGEEGRGLAYMFSMMNEARICVGAGAAALGYTGYLKSLEYARTRIQGRRAQEKDPAGPPVPIIEHPDVRAMLLAQKAYVEGALALVLYGALLADERDTNPDPRTRRRAGLLLDVLTPIVKSWPSQWCLRANSLAIQVHGGSGYARDYDVEQHYRDNRLNAIHEGTHGIQALDLLGRKMTMAHGAGFDALCDAIQGTCKRAVAAGGEMARFGAELWAVLGELGEVTRTVAAAGDKEVALANATVYLEVSGHVVVGWMWLEQMLVAGDRPGAFYAGKRQAARYFFTRELPTVGPQLQVLRAMDRLALDMRREWF
jgi:butyryl-CoA dehydrogenase